MGSYREEAEPGKREREEMRAKRKLDIQVEVNKGEGAFSGRVEKEGP